jgi:hypothetical protein
MLSAKQKAARVQEMWPASGDKFFHQALKV